MVHRLPQIESSAGRGWPSPTRPASRSQISTTGHAPTSAACFRIFWSRRNSSDLTGLDETEPGINLNGGASVYSWRP